MKQIGEETHTVVLDLFSYSVGLFEAIGRDNIHKYTSIKVGVNKGVWPDDFIKELNKPDTVSENTHFNKYGAWLLTKGLVKLINECEDKQIQGFEMTELLAAALSDMDIHSQREYAPFDVNAFEREALYAKRGLIPQIEPRYRYPYFSHIFDGGYSAGYYFYIWAQVLDKDAYEAFRQSGDIFNRKIARAFREKLLSRGGEADGMTLYRDFRGQDPDKAPLLKACGFWVEPESETDSLAVVRPAAERQLMPPANLLELRDKQENLK